MHYVLFIFFVGSTGTGPTMPVMHSADFYSLAACEAAAKQMNEFTAGRRVMYSKVNWLCQPKGEPAAQAAAEPKKAE